MIVTLVITTIIMKNNECGQMSCPAPFSDHGHHDKDHDHYHDHDNDHNHDHDHDNDHTHDHYHDNDHYDDHDHDNDHDGEQDHDKKMITMMMRMTRMSVERTLSIAL